MSTKRRGSATITVFSAILLLVTLLVWLYFAACASSLGGSDPAGDALAMAFTYFSGIALWVLLAASLVIAGIRGGFPAWTTLAAVILVPASAATAFRVIQFQSDNPHAAKWQLVVPFLAPLLILAYAVWAYLPALRVAIPSAPGLLWGGALVLSLLPWPSISTASHAIDQRTAELRAKHQAKADQEKQDRDSQDRDEWTARFQKLPPDPSLFQLSEFTRHGEELRSQAFEAIRKLSHRQSDAEDMLAHGLGWPLKEIQQLDLEATPSFCELSRKFLRSSVESISPPVPGRSYDWEKAQVDPYLPAMAWLVEHHCDCATELAAIEAAVRAYPEAADRNQTLATLASIRKTKPP